MMISLVAVTLLAANIDVQSQGAPSSQSPDIDAMLKRTLEQNVFRMHGICGRLVTPEGDLTSSCESEVTNMAFASGNSSFIATTKNKGGVSFRGRDTRARGDVAAISLDTILLTGSDVSQITTLKARGQCTYTNPNKGPVHVECDASTPNGKYELSFVSDGVWPPK